MAKERTPQLQQRMIEHEVRLSEKREAGEQYTARLEARFDQQSGHADRRWYRDQLVSMLMEARAEADLSGLGLSDEVIREARLGESVHEAWTRFHPPANHPTHPRGAPGSSLLRPG